MRGAWVRKCLETFGKRIVDRAETIDGVAAGQELGTWVDDMLTVAEVSFSRFGTSCKVPIEPITSQEEYELLLALAPLPASASISSTFTTLITPLLSLFTSTLSSLGTLIKRNLHKNTFLALASYTSLQALQARWGDVMARRADRKESELKEGMHSIRASCLRSFPEFLADIRAAGLTKNIDSGTGLTDVTVSVRHSSVRIRAHGS